MGVERMDEEPQRHADAGDPDDARRDRHRRPPGRERRWDLAERVYPARCAVPSVEEAERIRNERRLRALGIARARSTKMPIEPIDVGDAGVPAVVEGVAGEWRVDPDGARPGFRGEDGAAVSVRPVGVRPRRARRSSSTSSTCSRCTSRKTSGAGGTSPCRSSTRTGWSARSTRPPTASGRCWR